MSFEVNMSGWKRFFSVPCALVDNYLKLADGAALKVFLYLMSSEEAPDSQKIMNATGLSSEAFEDAVMFWQSVGVIKTESESSQIKCETAAASNNDVKKPTKKIVHTRYQPKDIAEMLTKDDGLRELFSEAESTLGRILRHADHETLISLRDYYGFSEQSIVLILGYCADLGKTSAGYIETVAKGLFDSGATEFHLIENEFEKLREKHSFESKIRLDFGMDVKFTKRQSQYIESWKNMGFSADMISLARERCVNNTNKLSFQYINKILESWHSKGYFTPEAAENDIKETPAKEESSFDLNEFDMFTLGTGKETK